MWELGTTAEFSILLLESCKKKPFFRTCQYNEVTTEHTYNTSEHLKFWIIVYFMLHGLGLWGKQSIIHS